MDRSGHHPDWPDTSVDQHLAYSCRPLHQCAGPSGQRQATGIDRLALDNMLHRVLRRHDRRGNRARCDGVCHQPGNGVGPRDRRVFSRAGAKGQKIWRERPSLEGVGVGFL
jgi:hypothetical protein